MSEPSSITEWPQGVSPKLGTQVESIAKRCLDQRKYRHRIEDNRLVVTLPDGEAVVSLWNIALTCASVSRFKRKAVIREFLLNTLETMGSSAVQGNASESAEFDSIKDSLTIQLMQPQPQMQTMCVSRDDLEGICTLLMMDLPETLQTATREAAAAWGVSDGELFEHAIANLRAMFEPDTNEIPIGPDKKVFIVTAAPPNDCYVAAQALMLDRFPQLIGSGGTLFAVPNRDMIFAYPANDSSVSEMVQALIMLTLKAIDERPYALSPHLYWRMPDGAMHVIRVGKDEGRVTVEPDMAVAEAIQGLPRAD